jgi:hypothetical protein
MKSKIFKICANTKNCAILEEEESIYYLNAMACPNIISFKITIVDALFSWDFQSLQAILN